MRTSQLGPDDMTRDAGQAPQGLVACASTMRAATRGTVGLDIPIALHRCELAEQDPRATWHSLTPSSTHALGALGLRFEVDGLLRRGLGLLSASAFSVRPSIHLRPTRARRTLVKPGRPWQRGEQPGFVLARELSAGATALEGGPYPGRRGPGTDPSPNLWHRPQTRDRWPPGASTSSRTRASARRTREDASGASARTLIWVSTSPCGADYTQPLWDHAAALRHHAGRALNARAGREGARSSVRVGKWDFVKVVGVEGVTCLCCGRLLRLLTWFCCSRAGPTMLSIRC